MSGKEAEGGGPSSRKSKLPPTGFEYGAIMSPFPDGLGRMGRWIGLRAAVGGGEGDEGSEGSRTRDCDCGECGVGRDAG